MGSSVSGQRIQHFDHTSGWKQATLPRYLCSATDLWDATETLAVLRRATAGKLSIARDVASNPIALILLPAETALRPHSSTNGCSADTVCMLQGDPVSVGLSSVGAAEVMLTAQVSASFPNDTTKRSEVKVVLRNVGDSPVDLANGTLRVVVTRYAD